MRHLKKILLFLFLQCSLYSSIELELDIRDFASLVATEKNINILLSPDINTSEHVFIISAQENHSLLDVFKKMLDYDDLVLVKDKGFYYVDKKQNKLKVPSTFVYQLPLKNLSYEDVEKYLIYNDINATYLQDSNSFIFQSAKSKYQEILSQIKNIDISLEQVTFKINVLETNLNDIRDRGFNLGAYHKSVDDKSKDINLNYFVNLITMPYTATTNVLNNSKSGFYATLNFLNQNDITNIQTSPILTAKNNKEVIFTSVQNIPYLTQTTTQERDATSTTSSYDYKDVGLKLNILPTIINDIVHFDLQIDIEDIIVSSLTPTVSKKSLKSSYSLKRGDLLILSGINKDTSFDTSFSIPLLSEIFIIGELFKFKSNKKITNTLTITIEVI